MVIKCSKSNFTLITAVNNSQVRYMIYTLGGFENSAVKYLCNQQHTRKCESISNEDCDIWLIK